MGDGRGAGVDGAGAAGLDAAEIIEGGREAGAADGWAGAGELRMRPGRSWGRGRAGAPGMAAAGEGEGGRAGAGDGVEGGRAEGAIAGGAGDGVDADAGPRLDWRAASRMRASVSGSIIAVPSSTAAGGVAIIGGANCGWGVGGAAPAGGMRGSTAAGRWEG
jgi:hypothetical protein